MPFEPFEAAWQRWDRARAHLDEAAGVWNEFIADHDAFDFVFDGDGSGTFILRVLQNRPTPPELAIAVGEWLYNLRATRLRGLGDGVLRSRPDAPSNEGVLQYPIYEERAAWERNAYRLKGLHQHHREMLLVMQPFNSDPDANYLGWLNRLACVDRHRTLVMGAARLARVEPVLQVPDGSAVTFEWGERTVLDGRADFARITVTPYQLGMEVNVNPRVGIDPEIGEWSRSPFWGQIPFDERLRMIQIFVSTEIAVYEYECTGGGRKAHLVADGFRTESDARRGSPVLQVRSRPEVVWTPAGPGARSTRHRFEGRDFPADGHGRRDARPREGEPPLD